MKKTDGQAGCIPNHRTTVVNSIRITAQPLKNGEQIEYAVELKTCRYRETFAIPRGNQRAANAVAEVRTLASKSSVEDAIFDIIDNPPDEWIMDLFEGSAERAATVLESLENDLSSGIIFVNEVAGRYTHP